MLHEMVITLTIAIVVLTGVAHLLVFTGQQRKLAGQRTSAAREAGNLMEDFVSRPWPEVSSEKLSTTKLSEGIRQDLPEVHLTVVVEEQDQAKRIAIQIDWQDLAGNPVAPVRLVGWRYPSSEAPQ